MTTTVRKARRSRQEVEGPAAPKDSKRNSVVIADRPATCADHKADDPVFGVLGRITGMSDKRSPVSNMRMLYQGRKSGPPELNFDIDLTKNSGEDERYVLSNEPSGEEREQRVQRQLCRLEGELRELWEQLEFVKGLRKEWNAQKAGLCNRRLKDPPPFCCKPDAANGKNVTDQTK